MPCRRLQEEAETESTTQVVANLTLEKRKDVGGQRLCQHSLKCKVYTLKYDREGEI